MTLLVDNTRVKKRGRFPLHGARQVYSRIVIGGDDGGGRQAQSKYTAILQLSGICIYIYMYRGFEISTTKLGPSEMHISARHLGRTTWLLIWRKASMKRRRSVKPITGFFARQSDFFLAPPVPLVASLFVYYAS